jgi:hypothetical protein
MKMAGSHGNAFFTNFNAYDAPFPSKVRLALANTWYAPGPAAAATTVSQAADSWPTDPVRVPTTTDTQTITKMSTADLARVARGRSTACVYASRERSMSPGVKRSHPARKHGQPAIIRYLSTPSLGCRGAHGNQRGRARTGGRQTGRTSQEIRVSDGQARTDAGDAGGAVRRGTPAPAGRWRRFAEGTRRRGLGRGRPLRRCSRPDR